MTYTYGDGYKSADRSHAFCNIGRARGLVEDIAMRTGSFDSHETRAALAEHLHSLEQQIAAIRAKVNAINNKAIRNAA